VLADKVKQQFIMKLRRLYMTACGIRLRLYLTACGIRLYLTACSIFMETEAISESLKLNETCLPFYLRAA